MKETATRKHHDTVDGSRALSPERRRGVRWFSALTQAVEGLGDDHHPFQHSIQFYSCYAESGDSRYLTLCEDFLKFAIRSMDRNAQPSR